MDTPFNTLATKETIDATIAALHTHGMEALYVETGADAKAKVLELIPKGSQVMNMTSVSLTEIGLDTVLLDESMFAPVRVQLNDPSVSADLKRQLGAAPQYTVGSAHAVTKDGEILVASNTGSQLPAYAYGASKVFFVIGAQKLVENKEEGMKRIYEYVLPLESVRANKAYNITTGSAVKKMLILKQEGQKGRITVIIVREKLGF